MHIERDDRLIPFGDIDAGDSFLECSGGIERLFIKTYVGEDRMSLEGVTNAVNLSDGSHSFFLDIRCVKKVNAVITYEA